MQIGIGFPEGDLPSDALVRWGFRDSNTGMLDG
jgi:hypothetical protein